MTSCFNTRFSTRQSFVLLAEKLLFYFRHVLPELSCAQGQAARPSGLPPNCSAALCSCLCICPQSLSCVPSPALRCPEQ